MLKWLWLPIDLDPSEDAYSANPTNPSCKDHITSSCSRVKRRQNKK